MRHEARSVWLVIAVACAVGCGKGSGGQAPGAGGSGGGTGGGGVHADGGPDVSGGPAITSAPPAWVRPADCMGVGETCQLGCAGAGAICQLDGDVCIPKPGPNGFAGRTAETPYCLAYACMTFDQASCFCTGPAGAGYPECKYGPAAAAGLCAAEQASCKETACCDGLRCTALSPTSSACFVPCATDSDCDTGCCTDLKDTGDKECAPASACQKPCTKRAGSCANDGDCCNGTCVTGTTNPDWIGCRPSCTSSADCDTGCCQLFAGSTSGFCTSIGYCGCGSGCAAGSTCLTFDTTNYGCYKDCTEDTDCPGKCCTADIPGQNHGSCVTATTCCPGGCPSGNSCLQVDSHPSCYKNCQQASECSSACCSLPPAGGTYGGCMPASACGL